MEIGPMIYEGHIYHKRFFPKVYELKHSVYFIKVPLLSLANIKLKLFSYNRFSLLSYFDRDHGFRNHQNNLLWCRQKLVENNITSEVDNIELITYPRVLGYVFNPVSFWFCSYKGHLVGVIVEVNNTFGETHSYILKPDHLEADKKFHVSPFYQVEGYYQFKFKIEESKLKLSILYFVGNELQLIATLDGIAKPLNDKNIFLTWIRNPIFTLYVIFMIHFHAIKMLFQKIPFYGKNGYKEKNHVRSS